MKQQNEMVLYGSEEFHDRTCKNRGNVYKALQRADNALDKLERIYSLYFEDPDGAKALIKEVLDSPSRLEDTILYTMYCITEAHKNMLPFANPSVQEKYIKEYEEKSMYNRMVHIRINYYF